MMKNVLLNFSVAMLLVSCGSKSSENLSENEKIVTHYFEYFNKHEWANMAAMYSEVADFKDPSLGHGEVELSQKQIMEKYAGLGEMFPNIHDSLVNVYPSGAKHIVVELISRGTSTSGETFELPICTIFTIEDGLITKDFTYYDNF